MKRAIDANTTVVEMRRFRGWNLWVIVLTVAAYASAKNRLAADTHLPSLYSLPFLRGGHAAAKVPRDQKIRRAHQWIPTFAHAFGSMQDTTKQWARPVGRQLNRALAPIQRLLSQRTRNRGGKLDASLHAFKNVLKGDDLDTAQLLEAIRAHLALMRSGGPALKLVARDLESNLHKAETLFRSLPDRDRRTLEVLLYSEKQEGVHVGNELDNKSGAMGLLWIRRSLEFQRNFYLALIPSNGRHPKDSAVTAYEETLSPYHGWLLRNIFPASLSQMPSRDVFIARFAGIELEDLSQEIESQVIRKLRSLVVTWEPLLVAWKDIFERLDLEDVRQV